MGSNPWRCHPGRSGSDCRPSGRNTTGQSASTWSGREEVRPELLWFSLKTERTGRLPGQGEPHTKGAAVVWGAGGSPHEMARGWLRKDLGGCSSVLVGTTPSNMWDLSSPTRGRAHTPCIESTVLTTGPGKSEALLIFIFCCCCSVTQLYLTLCDPMDCSTPGFPVLHYLPEFAQTHVH